MNTFKRSNPQNCPPFLPRPSCRRGAAEAIMGHPAGRHRHTRRTANPLCPPQEASQTQSYTTNKKNKACADDTGVSNNVASVVDGTYTREYRFAIKNTPHTHTQNIPHNTHRTRREKEEEREKSNSHPPPRATRSIETLQIISSQRRQEAARSPRRTPAALRSTGTPSFGSPPRSAPSSSRSP